MIPSMFKMMYICHAWHFDSADLWNQVLYKVEDISQYYKDIRSRNMGLGKNHPLVNRKFAYWVDENTLCIGYTLKSNPSVFRSVYKPGRMKYMREKILHNIPIVFKKRESPHVLFTIGRFGGGSGGKERKRREEKKKRKMEGERATQARFRESIGVADDNVTRMRGTLLTRRQELSVLQDDWGVRFKEKCSV